MSKISLTDATTLTNETTFISTLNANYATLETALDNTLSLNGTSPNSMGASLDMNSNRILNLPTPVLSNDVVRLQDMVTFTGGGTIAAFPTTSAGVASAISDETGSGSLVFGTSPTLTTPTITNPTVTTGIFTSPVITTPTITTKISPTTDDGAPLGDTTHNFSDLFLASGGVINWNAGDVTITHAANILTFGGANNGYRFDNTIFPVSADGASIGNGTLMWSDLFLADGGVINWNNSDVTITHSTNLLQFLGATSGYLFDSGIYPNANDGSPIGGTANQWSDLFLASGGVINWNNGNVTITHSAGALASNASWSQTGAMYILSGTAIPAGGTAGTGYKFSSTGTFGIYFGSGAPTLSAAQGSIYLRSDGSSTSTRLYVNTTGSTTWTNVTTAA